MKILIIARGYPTKKRIQNGNFESLQAHALKDIGHDIIYISVALRSFRAFKDVGFKYENIDGVHVYSLNKFMPIVRFLPEKLKEQMRKKLLKQLYQKIQERHGTPDIIHSHYLHISGITLGLKEMYNIPWVCTEHWSYLASDKISNKIQKLGEKVYNNADLVLAVSASLQKKIKDHFVIESKIVNNMVSKKFFNISRSINNDDTFNFIAVGSLIYRKGYDILIKAFANASFGKNITLRIIGDGDKKEELMQLTDSLNVSDQIIFTGLKNHNEVLEIMSKSDALVLTSRAETFGVVLIEALALGLPVIATICGGPEEFVNSENGILIEPNNIDATTSALKTMYQNIDKYDSFEISNECANNFSEEIIAKKITNEYNNILSNYKSSLGSI